MATINLSEKIHTESGPSKPSSNIYPLVLFSFLRATDAYLQYLVIFHEYGHQILSRADIATVSAGAKGAVLIVMVVGCGVEQIINMTYIFEARIPYSTAIIISIYNIMTNSFASFSSLIYGPSNKLGSLQYFGISLSLFMMGILMEIVSELQRKRFKDNAITKDKLYTNGLFSLARHVNHGGYTLWRTGLALTSGNYWLAAFQLIWHTWYFTKIGVPDLTDYCSKKYDSDWKKFEQDVPNILMPYIWQLIYGMG